MKKCILPIIVSILLSSCAINTALLENPAIYAKHYDGFRVVVIRFEYINQATDLYQGMDLISDPDIAIAIYNKNGQAVIRTDTIQDISYSKFPLGWGEYDGLFKNNEPYYLKVLDEDLTGYEVMTETEIKVIDCYMDKQQVTFSTKDGNLITLLLMPY